MSIIKKMDSCPPLNFSLIYNEIFSKDENSIYLSGEQGFIAISLQEDSGLRVQQGSRDGQRSEWDCKLVLPKIEDDQCEQEISCLLVGWDEEDENTVALLLNLKEVHPHQKMGKRPRAKTKRVNTSVHRLNTLLITHKFDNHL
jgi:hypothetical protein